MVQKQTSDQRKRMESRKEVKVAQEEHFRAWAEETPKTQRWEFCSGEMMRKIVAGAFGFVLA